jgi:hypothetical protein
MAELKLYRTYRFIDKDPVIDKIRTVFKDEGLLNPRGYDIAHQLSGVQISTYKNWFDGDTKRPTNPTIEATLTSLGYKREIVKDRSFDVDQELKKAAKWALQQNSNKDSPRKRNGHATRR